MSVHWKHARLARGVVGDGDDCAGAGCLPKDSKKSGTSLMEE
jgi:hypothetical protein